MMSGRDAVGADGGFDFASLYLCKTRTPQHRKMNGHFSELTFSPSPTKSPRSPHSDIDPDAFCNKDNVDQCALFINQEVTTLGMPSLYDGASPKFSIVRVLNCLNDILQKSQRSTRLREELENRIHRLESDESHNKLIQGRLKASVEDTQRKLAMAEEQLRQSINKNKLLTTKLKAEKEEVRRLQSEGQHRYAQFKHDLNKKDRETMKLKERLNQLLSDKCQEKKIGIEISEILQRGDGKRGTWQKRNQQEEELHREVISNYEQRQKELMVENEGLRQCISAFSNTLQKELDVLFKDNSVLIHHTDQYDSDEDNLSIESGNNSVLTDAHFEMPCEYLQENLERNMMENCRRIRKCFKRAAKAKGGGDSAGSTISEIPSPPHNSDKSQKEVERLHKQIERYRQIIEQQEQLIQQSLTTAPPSPATRAGGPDALEDLETLAAQKKLFEQQKAHFESERQTYNEAAVRLCRENSDDECGNTDLESESTGREAFENDRASFLAQQILQMTPFSTASSSRLRPHTPEKALLSPGMAAFSPAPTSNTGPVAPPSTADLYRFLGISPRETRNQQPSFASPALIRSGSKSQQNGECLSPLGDLSPKAPATSSSTSSPTHQSRISEHAHKVKMAVINREVRSPDPGQSPLC